MTAHDGRENEIKLAVRNAKTGRALLRRAGFRVSKRRLLERNAVFDTPERILRGSGRLLRIRTAGRGATLTYKGPPDGSRHKSREELETTILDPAALTAIVGKLGFQPVFRYEKYRTEYREASGAGLAMLDETPIGVFMELEGPPEWVDRMASELGFTESDYITVSYGSLYLDWRRRHSVEPGDMLFRPSRGASRQA